MVVAVVYVPPEDFLQAVTSVAVCRYQEQCIRLQQDYPPRRLGAMPDECLTLQYLSIARRIGHSSRYALLWVLVMFLLLDSRLGLAKENQRGEKATAFLPIDLKCEYARDPLGVDNPQPQLSWLLQASNSGHRQSAYQVLVASSPAELTKNKGDFWDSGRVRSEESTHIQYGGRPLTALLRVYWKVRLWDKDGRASDWSLPAAWEMGLLKPSDWQAQWIGSGPEREPRPAAGFFKSPKELAGTGQSVKVDGRSTLLRKQFVVSKPLRQARAYVTGLGYYEFSCNGRRVGDRVLAPAKTNYRRWVLYDTYDLTPQLEPGANVIGLMLGNGWFNPYEKWWEPYRMQWFGSKRALVQLRMDYTDGTSETVVSDGSWETAPGPVLSSCVYDGEVYDATQERAGWDRAGQDKAGWQPAHLVEAPGGDLVSHGMPPIRVTEHIRPVAVTHPAPAAYVYDLGQNFAGWARLSLQGPRGTRVTLRYAEDLRTNGLVDVTSNERALCTDVYVLKGGGVETYEPHFTFHGFRYVEITGFPGTPQLTNLLGCVVHTDCESTGTFVCDNELINRLHRATRWSQLSNLMGYPMDCPQRDERLGWFGDAMVTAEEAMFNFDLPLFYRHWLDGIRRNQNSADGDISIVSPRPYITDEPDPTWSSAYLVTVWQYYRHYGDREFLAAQFDAMRRYVDFLGTQATNHILPKYWIGDWGTVVEGWKEGEPISVSTAFYYYDATIVAKAARVLGRTAEADRYRQLSEQIRTAYNTAFYDRQKHRYDQGSEFSNAFPLYLGLAETSERSGLVTKILEDLQRRNGHFDVGVLGTKYLIDALTQAQRADIAYQLVNQTGYPSWAHLLDGGRTTLSEFWDLHGSHNHVMLGSIDAWFYTTLAGIQPDEDRPGFRQVRLKPFIPASLGFVQARVQTVQGSIEVEWRKVDRKLNFQVSLPPNSSGSLHLPTSAPKRVKTQPSLKLVGIDAGAAVYEFGSGTYRFIAELP